MEYFGRLEKVYIFERNESSGIAKIGDTYVCVTNAATSLKKECLIRVNFRQNRPDRYMGNFISQNTLQPHPLEPEDYLLIGLWETDMFKKHDYPKLNEINRYYDPGEMPQAVYIAKGSNKLNDYKGRVSINPKKPFELRNSFSRTLRRNLADPRRASRVIIAESEKDITDILKAAEELQLKTIRMDRLR